MVELEKDPLRPLHVSGIGGVDLAVPVVGEAEPLQLAAESGDVVLGVDPRDARRSCMAYSLGRQAKGVPAHGMQHVEPAHPLVAGDDVGGGVALRMARRAARRRWDRGTCRARNTSAGRRRSRARRDWEPKRCRAGPSEPARRARIRRRGMVCVSAPWCRGHYGERRETQPGKAPAEKAPDFGGPRRVAGIE